MAAHPHGSTGTPADTPDRYALASTAEFLDSTLGLYLSAEQKRGLATGLLIGSAVAGALVAWTIGEMVKRGRRG